METTSKYIIKYNELIAKFMGGEFRDDLKFTFIKSGWFNTPANDNTHVAQSHQFKYHSDWNWLMPVVEKIEKLNIGGCIVTIRPEHNHCFIDIGEIDISEIHFSIHGKSKKEAIWIGVINFIEWYNENQIKS